MNEKLIESVANAVLYEGYMLYPYRPSSVKNRQRWNFGVLYPQAYSNAQKGADAWMSQTQCLVRGDSSAEIAIRARFLQAVERQMGKPLRPISGNEVSAALEFEPVDALEVNGRPITSWQEAMERNVRVPAVDLQPLVSKPLRHNFRFPDGREIETLRDGGKIAGFIVRSRSELRGALEISAEQCGDKLFRLTVTLANLYDIKNAGEMQRPAALRRSLLSAHMILGVSGGEFVSLLDPPEELREVAAQCRNVGTWPVLIGEEHAVDAMLSSPIILYDYPQIAPESPGDLFDGTEIDEILALRILTLSDEEKEEIRRTDDRAREVLERTENLPEEQFLKLHGVLRGMKSPPSKNREPEASNE